MRDDGDEWLITRERVEPPRCCSDALLFRFGQVRSAGAAIHPQRDGQSPPGQRQPHVAQRRLREIELAQER